MRWHFINILWVLNWTSSVKFDSKGKGISFLLVSFSTKADYIWSHFDIIISGSVKFKVTWSTNIFYHNWRLNTINFNKKQSYIYFSVSLLIFPQSQLLFKLRHFFVIFNFFKQPESKFISTPEFWEKNTFHWDNWQKFILHWW